MTPDSELKKHIDGFNGARVLVIGDLMLDTYLIGNADRISPEAPVPVVHLQAREDKLGGSANCAMNIAALGGVPIIMGAVGRKEAGERFMDIVHQLGFDSSGILLHDYFLTTRKVRIVASGQQIVRVDEEEKLVFSDLFLNKALVFLEKALPTVDAVAVSDYAKGFITADIMGAVHDISRLHQKPVLVDPKPVNASLFRGCALMKPNCRESVQLSGVDIVDDKSCDIAGAKIMYEYSPVSLLITRGPDGMSFYRKESDPIHIKTRASRVFDVSGAGDTVLATLALCYAKGVDPVDSCRIAAAAASVVVNKPGTSTLTPDELSEALD